MKFNSMLIHTCCAPCALPIIEYLLNQKQNKDIVLYFYNPNIYPKQEHIKRLEQVKKISKIYNLKLIIDEYEHDKWLEYLKKSLLYSLESYPENDKRCLSCFSFRLDKTVEFAKENGFKEFATTLSINRFKDIKFINDYGFKIAKQNNLKYITFDLEPFQAYQKEQELIKKHNLYSQKYCGCEFSIK